MEEQNNFKSSWNMSEMLTYEANNHRVAANNMFVQGYYNRAMRHLISLKQTIIGILEDTEREKLIAKENEFIIQEALFFSCKERRERSSGDYKNLSTELNKYYSNLHKIYDEYNSMLMDYLQKKDLLLNAKKDNTKLTL